MKSIFVISFFFSFLFAFTQNTMPLNGATYGHVTSYSAYLMYYEIGSKVTVNYTDTIINFQEYSMFNSILTRYDNNILYVIDSSFSDDTHEYVLYDFNLDVYDIFHTPYVDEILVVSAKDSILLENGDYKQRLYLSDFFGDVVSIWIEGIGDILNTFFYYYEGFYTVYGKTRIVCFSHNNQVLYKDPFFNFECDSIENYEYSWTDIPEIGNNFSFCIVENTIHIVTNEDLYSYVVYDIWGKQFIQSSHESKSIDLDISLLNQGLYILIVTSKEKLYNYRFLKI